jgi:pimeloyl-ACP methyl ester carboxylesterase
MREEALLLGPYQSIAGVYTDTDNRKAGTAVICITAGLLHHVGPHRLHVLLARALAGQGTGALRFDLSGIGDSATRPDDLPAKDIPVTEINEAIAELEKRGYQRFILFGICSGAVQACRAAEANPKVCGLILVNTGADDGDKEVNPRLAAQYYLKRSLRNWNAWKNLFTGRVKYRELFSTLFSALLHKLTAKSKSTKSIGESLHAGLQPFIDRGVSILTILSDRHAAFYKLHKKDFDSLDCAQFRLLTYPESDHLFTSLAVQQDFIEQVCKWVDDRFSQTVIK